MLTVFIAIVMAVLDGAIANVALPTIAHDLGARPEDAIWVVNAYQLAVTMTLLPLASAGEIIGYRRIYWVGLALFTIASLCCALSSSLLTLTAARVLQGLGAAGIMSMNAALVRFIYPQRMLGRALGYNAMVVAVASAIGPSVAAAILAVAAWPWLFAINVPLGIVALVIAFPSLPRTPLSGRRFDTRSAVLSALAFGLLITGVSSLAHPADRSWAALELVGAVAAGAALVRREWPRNSPLLPVDLLRIPIFRLSIGTSIGSFCAQMMAFVALPFWLQDVLGRSEVATGLLITPWPLAVAVAAPLSGRLVERYPAGLLGGIGLAALCAGLLLVATLPAQPSDLAIVWRMALCGFGFGLFQTPNNRAMVGSAPRERSGGASGMLSTARLLGQTLGASLVAVTFGLSLARGSTLALLIASGCAGAACVVSCLRLAPSARAPRRKRA
jgi:DHA2 family multidrug resistance protein-like MFS transporter